MAHLQGKRAASTIPYALHPTAFNRARRMAARKVSTARELQHPHEARAPVVVVTDQEATECRRRRVDHDVGKDCIFVSAFGVV